MDLGDPSRYRLMQKHLCWGCCPVVTPMWPQLCPVSVNDSGASFLVTEAAGVCGISLGQPR